MEKEKGNLTNGIILLAVLHIIAVWGLKSETAMDFYFPYIPVLYLINFAFLLYYQKHWNLKAILFYAATFAAGFIVQSFAVNFKYPFGPFTYIHSCLGPQMLNTPFMIGVHWMLLIYCIGILLKNLNYSKVQKSLLGAFMLVLYDIVLEPIAKKNSLWYWLTKKDPLSNYNPVPLQNYLCWFVFGFLMLLYFNNAKAKLRNPIAPAVFIIMFFFLVAMHIY